MVRVDLFNHFVWSMKPCKYLLHLSDFAPFVLKHIPFSSLTNNPDPLSGKLAIYFNKTTMARFPTELTDVNKPQGMSLNFVLFHMFEYWKRDAKGKRDLDKLHIFIWDLCEAGLA